MTNPWQEWKQRNLERQKQGYVTPAALINPESPKADDVEAERRMAICSSCPHLLISKQCAKCACYMPIKTKLLHAACPVGKW